MMSEPGVELSAAEVARVVAEGLPKLRGEGRDGEGLVSAVVVAHRGWGRALSVLAVDWRLVHERGLEFADEGGTPVGSRRLAAAVLVAVRGAEADFLDKRHGALTGAPRRADVWEAEYEPEDMRSLIFAQEDAVAARREPTAAEQRAVDERAGLYGGRVVRVGVDPASLRATRGLPERAAEAVEWARSELERLAALPDDLVVEQGWPDANEPLVRYSVGRDGGVAGLWLHPRVFRLVGSKLGDVVVKLDGQARAGVLARTSPGVAPWAAERGEARG